MVKVRETPIKEWLLFGSIVVLPLMSLGRNPDILHDTYFFAEGKALLSGMQVHQDIFSAYGPLVPWLLALFINAFGEYLIVTRVLGALINLLICSLLFMLLRKKISRLNSLLLTSLFIALSPERTEISSPRWIYGAGIWPTSLTILLTLLLFLIISLIFDSKSISYSKNLRIFFLSLPLPLLLVSRIQGILVFTVFVVLALVTCYSGDKTQRTHFTFALLGIFVSTTSLLAAMASQGITRVTFAEMIFGPFTATSNVMAGRWGSWISALLISLISSCLALVLIWLVISKLLRRVNGSVIGAIYVVALLPTFYIAGKFTFPSQFNGNPLLWSLKITSGMPSWFTWPPVIVAVAIFLIKIVSTLKSRNSNLESNARSRDENLKNLFFILIGGASLTHLFWNYSYIYAVFPILITCILNLDLKLFVRALENKSSQLILQSTVIVLVLISIVGFGQRTYKYSYPIFSGMKDTRVYASELDEFLVRTESAGLIKTSQYLCDFTIFRYLDVGSFKVDKKFYQSARPSRQEYLRQLDNSVDTVLVCGRDRFYSEIELSGSGWRISSEQEIAGESSLSFQFLSRSGGG